MEESASLIKWDASLNVHKTVVAGGANGLEFRGSLDFGVGSAFRSTVTANEPLFAATKVTADLHLSKNYIQLLLIRSRQTFS